MSHNPQFISDNHYPASAIDYFTKGHPVVDTTWNRLSLMIKQGKLNSTERARLLLNSGLDVFKMDIACLTRIDGECMTIISSNDPQLQGKSFSLYQSPCKLTIEQDDVMVSRNVSAGSLDDYRMINPLQFATYIGIPVTINQGIYGTLFFASPHVRTVDFSARDKAFLKIMATSFRSIIKQQ